MDPEDDEAPAAGGAELERLEWLGMIRREIGPMIAFFEHLQGGANLVEIDRCRLIGVIQGLESLSASLVSHFGGARAQAQAAEPMGSAGQPYAGIDLESVQERLGLPGEYIDGVQAELDGIRELLLDEDSDVLTLYASAGPNIRHAIQGEIGSIVQALRTLEALCVAASRAVAEAQRRAAARPVPAVASASRAAARVAATGAVPARTPAAATAPSAPAGAPRRPAAPASPAAVAAAPASRTPPPSPAAEAPAMARADAAMPVPAAASAVARTIPVIRGAVPPLAPLVARSAPAPPVAPATAATAPPPPVAESVHALSEPNRLETPQQQEQSAEAGLLARVIDNWQSWFVPGTINFNIVRNGEAEFRSQINEVLGILVPQGRIVPPGILRKIVDDDLKRFFGMRSKLRSGITANELSAEFRISLRRCLR